MDLSLGPHAYVLSITLAVRNQPSNLSAYPASSYATRGKLQGRAVGVEAETPGEPCLPWPKALLLKVGKNLPW